MSSVSDGRVFDVSPDETLSPIGPGSARFSIVDWFSSNVEENNEAESLSVSTVGAGVDVVKFVGGTISVDDENDVSLMSMFLVLEDNADWHEIFTSVL